MSLLLERAEQQEYLVCRYTLHSKVQVENSTHGSKPFGLIRPLIQTLCGAGIKRYGKIRSDR